MSFRFRLLMLDNVLWTCSDTSVTFSVLRSLLAYTLARTGWPDSRSMGTLSGAVAEEVALCIRRTRTGTRTRTTDADADVDFVYSADSV